MIRRLTVVTATAGVLIAVAPAAVADIPADPAAWIMARGETIEWVSSSDRWARNATVVAEGPLPDRPGNRHTATIDAHVATSGGGPRPGPPMVALNVSLRDEECPATGGPCTTLWAGTGYPAPITTVPEPAADGSVRLQAPVPASVLRTTEPEGAPVPGGDTQLDVVLTPVNWSDPRSGDTSAADFVTRNASTAGGDAVSAQADEEGTEITATGTIAGVPAQRVTGGSWRDYGGAFGSPGPGLPPILTPADQEPYLPAVRNQRVNRLSYGAAFWDGTLAGSGPLRTSTGYRLPGNAWQARLFSQVTLQPGDRVEGVRPDGATLGLEGRRCAAGQAWEECAEVAMPTIDAPRSVRYRITFGGAIQYRFAAPVYEYLPDGTRRDRGTLDVRVTARPSGPATGMKSGWLVRATQQTWQFTATLRRPATALMTVAGRSVAGPGNNDNRFIEYATIGSGTL